jgi:hypothetical protein
MENNTDGSLRRRRRGWTSSGLMLLLLWWWSTSMIDELDDEAAVVMGDLNCCQGWTEVVRYPLGSNSLKDGLWEVKDEGARQSVERRVDRGTRQEDSTFMGLS